MATRLNESGRATFGRWKSCFARCSGLRLGRAGRRRAGFGLAAQFPTQFPQLVSDGVELLFQIVHAAVGPEGCRRGDAEAAATEPSGPETAAAGPSRWHSAGAAPGEEPTHAA